MLAVDDGAPMVISVVYMVQNYYLIRIITAWQGTVAEVKKYKQRRLFVEIFK